MLPLLRYDSAQVTFQEVPDEITLCINIKGCPIRCPDCHSKWLWTNSGPFLTEPFVRKLIEMHPNVTCVCFMGGDQNIHAVGRLIRYVYVKYRHKYKLAWYRGGDQTANLTYLDFIKVGPYKKECGGLSCKSTNQRFYAITHKLDENGNLAIDDIQNITYKFWR